MKIDKIGDVYTLYPVKIFADRLKDPAYLLGVYYDGTLGKAVLEFISEDGKKIILIPDPTGHRPYFLTDVPPDKVREIKQIVNHPSFDRIETVYKYDLLLGKQRLMTKIVTKDPLAVAHLRDKVPKAWEAKIKYHDNYVFDRQLIPGMKYVMENNYSFKLIIPKITKATYDLVRKIFEKEPQETQELAIQWTPLFEEKPPAARRIALDIEVYTPFKGRVPHASRAEYPIISIALVANDGFKKVLVLAREHQWGEIPKEYPSNAIVEFFEDEYTMILETFRIIGNYPIVLTFNGDNFDLNYLYHRALKLGIPRDIIPLHMAEDMIRIKTSIHLDLYKFFVNRAIQSYAFGGKYQEFTLDAIASALLGASKIPIEENIGDLPYGKLIAYNYRDAYLTLELTLFNNELVWKLMILLARIAKTSIEDICRKTISKWIQNLFYWEHRRRGYLIPEPEDIRKIKGGISKTEATIQGRKYAGALVLEPPMGVFFNVVVMDIASLYPSIIKKYNLSYETVNVEDCKNVVHATDETGTKVHSICFDRPGLTSQIIGLLRDFRVGVYKKKAKDKSISDVERSWYDIVQRAMKVFINASYGVFGAANFPLYAPAVAESVTALGRRALYSILQKAADIGIKVLYGDTDSIFLWAPSEEQINIIQQWVEEFLGLEIELDKVFTYVLFTGLKKNYIGLSTDGSIEIKGLIAKKRNTPTFLKELFIDLIEMFKSAQSPEDFIRIKEWLQNKVKTLYLQLKNKEITLDKLAFKVTLSKPLEEYKKTRPQHVKAALQLKHYGVNVLPGDIIVFVKVKSKDGVKAIQLAKLYEIDPDKYIEQIKTALSQLLSAFGVEWDEIIGLSKLESYFTLH